MASVPRIVRFLIFFAYLLVAYRAIFISAGNGRSQLRGDSYTEYLSYNGIRYFFDHGFLATYLLPNVGYKGDIADKKQKEFGPSQIYAHYPPLTDNFTAITALAMGTVDMRVLRLVPIILSLLWLIVMLRTLRMYHTREVEVWLSFAILLMSNYFIAWADNINKYMYEELIKWTILLIALRRNKVGGRRTDLPLLGGLFFVLANISYDGLVVAAFLLVGTTFAYKKRIFTADTVIPGIAALAGVALHFFQTYLFFGSWEAFVADLKHVLALRALGNAPGSEVAPLTLSSWLGHFLFWNPNRIERFFLVPGWALAFFSIILYRHWRDTHDERRKLLFVTLLGAVSWNLLMWQHSMVHVWVARNWGIFVGLIAGPGLFWLYGKLRARAAQPIWQYSLLWILALYIAGMAITQQIWDLYLRHGFLYHFFES